MGPLHNESWSTVPIKKGNRFINANVYELYVLDVYGRPTEAQFTPWIIVMNVAAMAGYVLGSVLFLWDWLKDPSLIIFAVASFFDGLACLGMLWKAIKREKWMIATADVALVIGCILFGITSIPPLYTLYRIPIISVWLASSVCFLAGCALLQAALVKSLGWAGAFVSVPLEALNVLGSIFFVVGTAVLFDHSYHIVGTWNYIIGSIVFLFTSVASILVANIHTPSRMAVKLLYSTTASFDATYGSSLESPSNCAANAAILRNAAQGHSTPSSIAKSQ